MQRKRWFGPALGALALLILPAQFLPFRLCVISGRSMTPSANPGELWWIDGLAARRPTLHRGDIVVFRHGGDVVVKRILGLPGDRICERLLADGRSLVTRNPHDVHDAVKAARSARVLVTTVRVGECYVLGDNRSHSDDSRAFGPIDQRAIVGVLRPFTLSSVAEVLGELFLREV